MTRVWPALWPPWKRTTTSARSDSQSTILPLPSSPHCAPTTTTLAIVRSSLESQGSCLTHLRQRLDGGEHRRRHRAIDLDQRDGIAARLVAAEMEGRDIDAAIAENGSEGADEARLVGIGDVEHVGAELGLHVDALDLDDPRLAVRGHRAGNAALQGLRPEERRR